MQNITVEELEARLQNSGNKPLLLDVREPWEFAICHIEGSQLIPMREIPNAMGQFEADQEIVVVCHTGVRSMHVCYYLQNEGFDNVANLTGGVHAWASRIDPNMPTY